MVSETDPPLRFGPELEERTEDRVPIAWAASIWSVEFEAEPCQVTDVTHLGCRARLARPITTGTYVTIAIADFAEVSGWVIWNQKGEIGVEFSHPLPTEVLVDMILKRD